MTDRFNLVMDAVKMLVEDGLIEESRKNDIVKKYEKKLADHSKFIIENGVDPDEIENWEWNSRK